MSHNPDFWRARWKNNQIGFHQPAPSVLLVDQYATFKPTPSSRVLVPLCGKSKDLVWLANQGHQVVGVEAVEEAVAAFFEEEGKQERIEILTSDFFKVSAKKVGRFDWIFDRGALVAMDDDAQPGYAMHSASFLEPNGRIFLIGIEYDDSKMSGPPFSIPESKVRNLYSAARTIERLADRDCLEPRYVERGLSAMREAAYAIQF